MKYDSEIRYLPQDAANISAKYSDVFERPSFSSLERFLFQSSAIRGIDAVALIAHRDTLRGRALDVWRIMDQRDFSDIDKLHFLRPRLDLWEHIFRKFQKTVKQSILRYPDISSWAFNTNGNSQEVWTSSFLEYLKVDPFYRCQQYRARSEDIQVTIAMINP